MSMAMLVFPGGRPDFAVLVYPGGLIKRGSDRISPSVRVTLQTPPMFLVHASDDPGVENSVFLYLTLKRAGIPAELHIYGSGGHGFGVRPSNKPCATWTQRCEDWLRAQGLLKAAAKK
jgi:acetyl esterase/lipase